MAPNSGVLIALCRILRVDSDYFFRPTKVALTGIEFRKRPKCGKKEVDRIREEAHDFFERYLEIESILALETRIFPRSDLSSMRDFSELAAGAEDAADQLRKDWKLGENPIMGWASSGR